MQQEVNMKKYQKKNRRAFVCALVCMLASAVFAVRLQFLKGGVLDYAVAGDTGNALRHALLLVGFILGECGCYFLDMRFRAKFVTGCAGALKQDIFESILRRSYVDYRKQPQGRISPDSPRKPTPFAIGISGCSRRSGRFCSGSSW